MTICAPIWRDFMLTGVPIYQAALAKETARNKAAAPKAAPPPVPNIDASDTLAGDTGYYSRRNRRRHRPTDTTADITAPDTTGANVTDSTSNVDGTTTATVDDETGLLAPPGAAHSHSETFSPGAAPTVMAPQYDSSQAGTTDSSPTPAPAPTPHPRRRPRANSVSPGSVAPNSQPTPLDITAPSDTGAPADAVNTAPPRRAAAPPAPRPKPVPQYVTVRINPDDGLLATQWTPQYVEKKFLKGHEPHRYSRMYQPPPGER